MAVLCEQVRLSGYTTLRLGGPADRFVEAATEAELLAAVKSADRAGEPLLVLGGGSNLVVSDEGFSGTALHVSTRGVTERGDLVTAQAGEDWDAFVDRCVAGGRAGIEALSGIPGRIGATPIQNVGAYGQQVADTVAWVRAHDRRLGETVTLDREACRFSYRHSAFKDEPDRFVVLEVAFTLAHAEESAPIRYAELARSLGVEVGERAPLADVRQAVLALRSGKGMVLDPADPDTRSAGSFFTNPVLSAGQVAELERRVRERLGADASFPRYPESGGRTKTSAAWLIERAGFTKGYGDGPARISTKHTLALTNPGGASTGDLLALARAVRAGVWDAFGVTLVNEPVFVGVALDGA